MRSSMEDIVKVSENWSIEVILSGAEKIKDFRKDLIQGTTVNVTFLPNLDISNTINVACRLSNDGMNRVLHIAARSLESKDHLDDLLAQLVNDAGVKEVLVIGDSRANTVGPFPSSMDVLKSGPLQKYQIKKLYCRVSQRKSRH